MAATHMNSMLAVSWQLNDVPVGKGISPGKRKVEDFQPSKSNKKGTVDLLPLPLPLPPAVTPQQAAQMPLAVGGGNGKARCSRSPALAHRAEVCYIDTENTFRPERLRQIAEANGIDPTEALDNIMCAHADIFSCFFDVFDWRNSLSSASP